MMYDSWDIKCKRQSFLWFWAIFCPDTPNNPKNQNSEKIKKHLEILSFYTCVPQMTIIWYMVLEISSMPERIFCHFGLFLALLPPPPLPNNPEDIIRTSWRYYHFTHKNHRSKSYAWFLRYGVWQTELFLILDHFLPFYPSPLPLTTQRIKIFKKWKKNP